jgi:putative hemolysin
MIFYSQIHLRKRLFIGLLCLFLITLINLNTVIAAPSYDPKILNAFDNQTWVGVIVRFHDGSNITVTGTTEERRVLLAKKDAWFNPIVDDEISELSDTKFRNIGKLTDGFGADITKEGVYFLSNDSRIENIIWITTGAVNSDLRIGIPNPASMYASKMGCTHKTMTIKEGQIGVCIFPDGSECEEWAFYRGKCGQEWSYCELHGYDLKNLSQQEGWFKGGICVDNKGIEIGNVYDLLLLGGPAKNVQQIIPNTTKDVATHSYDPKILNAFDNQTWVGVIVRFYDSSNMIVNGTIIERREPLAKRNSWFDSIEDDNILNLSAPQFRNIRIRSNGFGVQLTREGYYYLSNASYIKSINLVTTDVSVGPVQQIMLPDNSNDTEHGANQIENKNNVSIDNQSNAATNQSNIKVEKLSLFQRIMGFMQSLF